MAPIALADSTDQIARFKASGWNDDAASTGMIAEQIAAAMDAARKSDRPTLIAGEDNDRLRRAHQGGHRQGRMARRSAPRRSRARAKSSAGRSALHRSRPTAQGVARSRQARRRKTQGLGEAPRRDRRSDARRIRAPHRRRPAGGVRRGNRRASRRSSPPTSRRWQPANPPRRCLRSSTASCRRRSAARPTSPDPTTPGRARPSRLAPADYSRPLYPLRHSRTWHGRRP